MVNLKQDFPEAAVSVHIPAQTIKSWGLIVDRDDINWMFPLRVFQLQLVSETVPLQLLLQLTDLFPLMVISVTININHTGLYWLFIQPLCMYRMCAAVGNGCVTLRRKIQTTRLCLKRDRAASTGAKVDDSLRTVIETTYSGRQRLLITLTLSSPAMSDDFASKRSRPYWSNPPFLNFWHSGTPALRTERLSARMSKI